MRQRDAPVRAASFDNRDELVIESSEAEFRQLKKKLQRQCSRLTQHTVKKEKKWVLKHVHVDGALAAMTYSDCKYSNQPRD